MRILTFVYLLFFIQFSDELNNGLGRTPQMGMIFYDVDEYEYTAYFFY